MGTVLLPMVSSIDVMPLGPMDPSPSMPVSVIFVLMTDGPISPYARECHVCLDKFGIGLPKLLEGGIGHHVHRSASVNQHAGHRRAVQVPTNLQWLRIIF
jgi:hypothetical protein